MATILVELELLDCIIQAKYFSSIKTNRGVKFDLANCELLMS